jgi:hypothetical protein
MKREIGEYIIETDKIHYIHYTGQDGFSYFLDRNAKVVISFDFQSIEFCAYSIGFDNAYNLFLEWSGKQQKQENGFIDTLKRLLKYEYK